jgi:hypothetical protein
MSFQVFGSGSEDDVIGMPVVRVEIKVVKFVIRRNLAAVSCNPGKFVNRNMQASTIWFCVTGRHKDQLTVPLCKLLASESDGNSDEGIEMSVAIVSNPQRVRLVPRVYAMPCRQYLHGISIDNDSARS